MGETAVVGAKDRKTKRVAARVVEDTRRKTPLKFVRDAVLPEAEVYTVDSPAYIGLKQYAHDSANHSGQEYVRYQVHTNGSESLWSMLKRGYVGTYDKMSPEHAHWNASPDFSPERLIKAAFSAISVVTSITYRAEGTRPYERRLYQN